MKQKTDRQDAQMRIRDDGTLAKIDVQETMSASEIEALIRRLALLRGKMQPAVPASQDETGDNAAFLLQNMQAASMRQLSSGDFRLWLRHQGIGWMAWNIEARQARAMAGFITRRTPEGDAIDLFGAQDGPLH